MELEVGEGSSSSLPEGCGRQNSRGSLYLHFLPTRLLQNPICFTHHQVCNNNTTQPSGFGHKASSHSSGYSHAPSTNTEGRRPPRPVGTSLTNVLLQVSLQFCVGPDLYSHSSSFSKTKLCSPRSRLHLQMLTENGLRVQTHLYPRRQHSALRCSQTSPPAHQPPLPYLSGALLFTRSISAVNLNIPFNLIFG